MHESYANVVFPLWSREVREEENIFLKKERVKKIGNEKKKKFKERTKALRVYQVIKRIITKQK